MINFIYGISGSGKSAEVRDGIVADVAAGRRVWLIVPEQQTYTVERRFTALLPPSAQLSFEVVNFTRLADIARRRFGGLTYNYADGGTKSLLMWRTLREVAPLLEEYGEVAANDSRAVALSDLMLRTISELKAAGFRPQSLERAAEKLERDSSLGRRMRDIALVWASYANLLSAGFDDAADDLTHLTELLESHDLFADRSVYIDSFTSYTGQEYRIIDYIMKQAPSLVVTVGCEMPGSTRVHFASIAQAEARLRRMADARGGYSVRCLGVPRRFAAPELAVIERCLWDSAAAPSADEPDACTDSETCVNHEACLDSEPRVNTEVRAAPEARLGTDARGGDDSVKDFPPVEIACAPTPYAEAQWAASRICEALRAGMRYRDIAVIARDATRWNGIIDATFDKYRIPYFISEHTELDSKPIFKLITSALSIKNRGWRQNDVISLIKTGLCGFSDRECDVFEDYCATWNITGKMFLERAWSMNPDGYVTELGPRAADILHTANSVRERLTAPLTALFARLDAADSAAGMCRAIYAYTEGLNVRRALDLVAERESEAGNVRAASDTLRLYNIYIDSLDRVSAALADETPDTETLATALRIVLAKAQVGALPTRHDEVTVGSASLLRADSPRMVIVIGLCEGEFPAEVDESGLFSFADRARLSALGLELESDPGIASAEELFFAYRALTAPSERLLLSYSSAACDGARRQPSRVISRVRELLPAVAVTDVAALPPLGLIQSPEVALEYLASLGDTDEAAALRAVLSRDAGLAPRLAALDIPVSDADCTVSRDTGDALFDGAALSQSRLESYIMCPFGYYCDYVLGLRTSGPADFSSANVGVFIHYVMECFLREATAAGGLDTSLDDEAVERLADRIIEDYSRRLMPDDDRRAGHMAFLVMRLKRIAMVLIYNIMDEFRHSLFRPSFFELSVDGSDPAFPEAASFPTPSGDALPLRGVVDRVDLFRRGDDVYIRVVDYKTGKKVYSPDDVAEGLGLQLLLYLFTLCNSGSEQFRNAVGCPPNGHIYPAGALYLSANLPLITVDRDISPEEIRRYAIENIKRSGPLLGERDIMLAMNDTLDPAFLGTPRTSRGKDNTLSLDGFGELCGEISKTLGIINEKMRSGNASAAPRRHNGRSQCDNCEYSAVCRSARPTPGH